MEAETRKKKELRLQPCSFDDDKKKDKNCAKDVAYKHTHTQRKTSEKKSISGRFMPSEVERHAASDLLLLAFLVFLMRKYIAILHTAL